MRKTTPKGLKGLQHLAQGNALGTNGKRNFCPFWAQNDVCLNIPRHSPGYVLDAPSGRYWS